MKKTILCLSVFCIFCFTQCKAQPTEKSGVIDADGAYSHYASSLEAHLRQQDYKTAHIEAAEACRLDPTVAKYFIQRSNMAELLPESDKEYILQGYSEAIKLDPKNEIAYLARARTYHKLFANYEAAVNDYNVAIGLEPFGIIHHEKRARVFFDKGDYYNALCDYYVIARYDYTVEGRDYIIKTYTSKIDETVFKLLEAVSANPEIASSSITNIAEKIENLDIADAKFIHGLKTINSGYELLNKLGVRSIDENEN
jgi:tetratricopeptide (TPR) repeat protein